MLGPSRRWLIGGLGVALVLTACGRDRDPAPAIIAQAAASQPAKDGRIAIPAKPGAPETDRTIRSVLDVRTPMVYGDYLWNEAGAAPGGPIWVRIDLAKQLISVFRGGHEIGTAVILYGANGKETPVGDFPVLQKAVEYHSHTYDAEMPYMLRLTADGVAIHASNVREGWATHGCIGVPRAFAEKLFGAVKLGDPVTIVGL